MTRKRVLLLSQWFEPEPTFKGLVFARELIARGYDVEVVTGFPNYPGGKLYPGFKMSLLKRETIDGVQVTRLPLYPSHDASAVRRITNYVSFAISSALYCLFVAKKANVVYVYQLLTLGVVAALIRAVRGTPFVFDIQDVWPDTLRATGMVNSERVLGAVDRAARWTYRRAARIVVLSPGFRQLLLERGVPDEKIELIYNWCDEVSLAAPRDVDLAGFPADDRFRLVFAGNMGKAQALDTVLDAASILLHRSSSVTIVMIGGGVETERLKVEAAQRGLLNVVFIPRVGMDRIGAFLQSADALLIHLKADPLFSITVPGKTQAYMSIGKPILMAAPGDAATLVRKAECGLEAIPQNAASIADAAEALARLTPADRTAMGRRGRSFYRQHLALSVGVGRFTQLFEGMM